MKQGDRLPSLASLRPAYLVPAYLVPAYLVPAYLLAAYLLAAYLLACWLLAANDARAEEWRRHARAEVHMGAKFVILAYSQDADAARRGLDAAFERIEQLDNRLSDYKPESELNRLCRTAPHAQAVPVSKDLATVLRRSLEISRVSQGAFDVTVGPLTRLWRKARRSRKLPPADVLASARAAVGFQKIQVTSAGRVKLAVANMQLDLGGIAKGYAADEAVRVLKVHGLTRALVNAGGDMRAGDAPPDRPGWRIGVAPLNPRGRPSRVLTLRQQGVATSGDAWQHVEIDGVRYSHILNPRTGLGLTQRSSVTVLAADATLADAWASTLSVLGPDRGLPLLEKLPGAAALIVVADGKGRATTHSSKRFPPPNRKDPAPK